MEEQTTFEFPECNGSFKLAKDGKTVTIDIQFSYIDGNEASFVAAAPAPKNSSYSGSGLPFVSPSMAIDKTPNKGTFHVDAMNKGSFQVLVPNSYYAALGTVLIPPTVYVTCRVHDEEKTISIQVNSPIPFRTLTYDNKRTSANFYNNLKDLPVRSQEQILRDSAYPCKIEPQPSNFWGLKPAV